MNIIAIFIFAIIVLGCIAATMGLFGRKSPDGQQDLVNPSFDDCASCDGSSQKCEQECYMEAATREIEYFDDEELDAFQGRPADAYTAEEVEQFREVLYTMNTDEVKSWNRSLLLRGVNVPDQLKDELIMMMQTE